MAAAEADATVGRAKWAAGEANRQGWERAAPEQVEAEGGETAACEGDNARPEKAAST